MKLSKIKISGYKSINELEFPVKKYGSGENESYTTILIGKNETGKSNVLDSIRVLQLFENQETINFTSIRNQQNEPERVSIRLTYDLEENDSYRQAISKSIDIPNELVDKLVITQITKEVYAIKDATTYAMNFDFKGSIGGVKEYSYAKINEVVAGTVPPQNIAKTIIKKTSDIKPEEVGYEVLDRETFKVVVKEALSKYISDINTPVDYWKSDNKYLIKDRVDLRAFATNPNDNIPLKNMFFLAGYKDDIQIRQVVNDIENDNNKRKNLETSLSEDTTKYINDRWQEHKIKIVVDIDSSDLSSTVSVQDIDDGRHYFGMTERSEGFKQFISLLLSISISSTSDDTVGHLIIIDEPEVHLHPSGIRYMLKELLSIGKKNYLFVSTHSNFMIDTDVKERHYLLTKNDCNLTNAQQIRTEQNIHSDEILQQAFGVNMITDFLSPHNLLVEGMTDKIIIEKALVIANKNHDITVSKGVGNNTPASSSVLTTFFKVSNHKVLVDDDRAGKDIKAKIEGDEEFKGEVFSISELNNSIISGGTIEDALPMAYVQSVANKILSKYTIASINLIDTSAFCKQIQDHISKEISQMKPKPSIKEIISEIKTAVANEYKPVISKFATDSPKLYKLAEEILTKFGIPLIKK